MRITFVLASGFGLSGGERVIAQFAYRLQQQGHQVLLVSPPLPPRAWRERARRWKRLEFDRTPQPSHFDYAPVPRVVLERRRPVTDGDLPDADFVIATWWETAEWVSTLSPRKGIGVYLIQHHEVFDYMPQVRVAATYRSPLRKIVISSWLETLMREQYGDTQTVRISPGVDRAQFDAPRRGKQSIPTFGFLYSPLYRKGCDVILKAIALAKTTVPEMRIVAFGAEQPVRALPLPRGVRFHLRPPQMTLRAFYAGCDAWLFGSRSEGFALPPMEAMACRTPVIGTPVGGVADLIAANGMLVPPEDYAVMAQHMRSIAGMSDAEWRALSDKAYRAIAPFTWERATGELEQALRAIAACEKDT